MTREEQFRKMAAAAGRQEFEKEAVWGALKGAYTGLRSLGTGLFGRAGQAVTGAVGKHSPEAARWLARTGKGAAPEMWTFGMLGGGLGAMTNPEDRMGGFMRGFAGGALGGLGWRAGSNVARRAMQKGLLKVPGGKEFMYKGYKQRLFRPLTGAEKGRKLLAKGPKGAQVPGLWSRRTFGAGRQMSYADAAKHIGRRAVLGGVPIAGALGVSSMMPTFEGNQQIPQAMRVPPQAYYHAMQRTPGYY